MNLFKRSIELVVIRDIFNPPILDENDNPIFEIYHGDNIEKLLKQAFGGNGLSDSVRLYHGNLLDEVTPKTPQDVDRVMRLHGRIYAVVKPMGIETLIAIGVSILVSVAIAFLMPVPAMPNASNQPPSPNNALAARTNKQRLGGRIPDIYGTVWSVPDLIAVTYSIYVDHKEIEYSYMCVGRGRYNVQQALDDTTPIAQVAGASVLVYDPDTNLNDEPSFVFGSQFNPNEALLARLAAKKYTAVNGQTLIPANSYHRELSAQFKAPNIIESAYLAARWRAGDILNIEGADGIYSIPPEPPEGEPPLTPNIYSLSGIYEVLSVSGNQVTLKNPETVNSQWSVLAANNDVTEVVKIGASTQKENYWQGWFYTSGTEHTGAYVSVVAPSGIFVSQDEGKIRGLCVQVIVESEIVDINGNPINGTLHEQGLQICSPSMVDPNVSNADTYYQLAAAQFGGSKEYIDNLTRSTAAQTIAITNPNMAKGKRMRVRVARGFEHTHPSWGISQEVKVEAFYGYHTMTANDTPKGVTTVYTKTLATEGALSLKERKLRLLVQRYVTDATSGLPKLSDRADDILRDIATDPKIGNLQLTQVDIAQIKAEIDAQIAYFGTDKCSQFCGTFDDNNLSAEETMQIVAKAVFSQAKRQGNKIMLDFERKVPASVAVFNSHNIIPDTFTAPQSLGIANDYDGVKIEYTDPIDDAIITLTYPNDAITNPHEDKLIGVRNKVQAHTHMMRMYNKDRHAYKSCEFVAGDESNIVVRTNRITVADQLRADVQQGSVDSIETIGGDIVMHVYGDVNIDPLVPHTMFIQTINNGVEAIAVTARDSASVKLARLPSGEISGADKAVQAVYQIVSETDDNRDAYLVAQKDPSDGMTNKLLCTNYDDRYYQNDSDFKDKAFYADFTNDRYVKDGVPCGFNDLFTFNRAGKAWLVKDTGLQEYAADEPRFDNGLLVEQSATNQALDSLIKNGVNSFDIKASSLLTISADTQLGIGTKVLFPQGVLSYAYKAIPLADVGSHTLTSYVSKSDGSTDIILGRETSEDALLLGADRSTFAYKNMRFGLVRVSGISDSSTNRGIVRYAEQITRTGNLRLHAMQLESGSKVTSLIVTEETPVTRPADFLLNKDTGTTVTGDWDSTLTLSIVNGQLVHSGYGRIRSLEIN